jgi:hypothetical protein
LTLTGEYFFASASRNFPTSALEMREPELSPRAEPVQKLGNNAGITTKGCIGGFAFFALKPTVEISGYRSVDSKQFRNASYNLSQIETLEREVKELKDEVESLKEKPR